MSLFGGRQLGRASGSIVINDQDLDRVEQSSRRVGQNVRRNLARIDDGARTAQRGLQQLGAQGTLGRLNALGAAAGAIAGLFAVQLAQGALRAVVGLAELRNTTVRAGIAFELLAGNADLAAARIRAVQVASGNAVTTLEAQRIATQAASLGLATTSQELARLTNAARAAAIVSPVINDIGSAITELGLASANLSFRRLDQLGLSVTEVRQRMSELREENADLDESQLFLQASVDALNEKYAELLESERLNAPGTERLGTAYQEATVAISEYTGWVDRLAGALAGSLNEVATQATALRLLRTEYENLTPEQQEVLDQMRELTLTSNGFTRVATPEQIEALRELIAHWGDLAEAIAAANEEMDTVPRGVRSLIQFGQLQRGEIDPSDPRIPPSIRQRLGAGDPMFAEPPGAEDRPRIGDINAERREESRKALEEIAELERDYARDRQRATEQFESQRTRTIRDFERQIARDAEDFARQRARQNADLQRQIAEIQEQGAEREVEARRQLEERVADITEDFQERRARLERDHRETVADAAARLDARAVREEQRRFQRQRSDLEEDFEDRLRDERESVQERNETAREADAERIQDLRENLARQQEIEDQERGIRLRRLQEDHQRQLQEQVQAHSQRLSELTAFHNEALAEQQRFIRVATGQWRQAATEAARPIIGPPTQSQSTVERFPSLRDPNFTVPRSTSTSSSVRSSVVIAEGAIQVNGVSNPIVAGDIVEDRLISILRKYAETNR